MKNKRILSTMSILFLTAIMFLGCGNTEENIESAETTIPSVEVVEDTDDTSSTTDNIETETEIVDVDVAEEESISAFMEQEGFNFDIVPEEFFILQTYNSKDEEVREQLDFDTVLTGVSSFESSDIFSDVEGYHYEQGTFFIWANPNGSGVNFQAYICDYYTGTVVEFTEGTEVDAEITKAEADNSFIVNVGETEYSITAFSNFEYVGDGWQLTFTVLVPDEYDGLCFGIGGITLEETTTDEEDEIEEDAEDNEVMLITDTSYKNVPETWHFYHVQ